MDGLASKIRAVAPFLVVALIVSLGASGCTDRRAQETADARADVRGYVESALDFMETKGLLVNDATWGDVRRKALSRTAFDTEYSQTYGALRLAVWAAGGTRHSSFRTPETANHSEVRPPTLATGPSGVASITLPTFASMSNAEVRAYADAGVSGIDGARGAATCGWVIDLRENGGGNMYPMLAAISPLLDQGPLLSFVDKAGRTETVSLHGSTVGFSSADPHSLTAPDIAPLRASQRIAVLQGVETASSGEAVLLALRDQPGVRTFGQTSAGFATGNVVKRMPDGALIVLTTSHMIDSDANRYGHGVPADQETDAVDASGNGDPTRDAGTAWLQTQCG